LGLCLWLSVLQMAERGPAYRERVGELVAKATTRFDLKFATRTDEEFTANQTDDTPDPRVVPDDGSNAESGAAARQTGIKELRGAVDSFVRDSVARLSAEFFSLLSTSMVVLIYVFFLLAGVRNTPDQAEAYRQIDIQVRSYLALKTIISIVTGAVFGFTLWLFGVPMSLTFGVLAFLLNYIPNVGPLVASLLPIPFILLDPTGSVGWMIATVGSMCAIQAFSGNFAEPRIMGKSSDLHPVVILFALMFWGMMWGITGMFLATPLTAALRIVLEGIDSAKPIANLLAGRWEKT
jgi:AI-2 transport protein TqsA